MTMRVAKVDGFKFSPDGMKVIETIEGKSYDIPDDKHKVWQEAGKFEEGAAKVKAPKVKKSIGGEEDK